MVYKVGGADNEDCKVAYVEGTLTSGNGEDEKYFISFFKKIVQHK